MIEQSLANVIGYLGLSLSVGVLIPQIWKTYTSKDTGSLSIWMYVQLAVACVLLILKAYLTGANFFILSYGCTLTSALTMIYLIRRYK